MKGMIKNKGIYWETDTYNEKLGQENEVTNVCEVEVSKIEDQILGLRKTLRDIEKTAEDKVNKIWVK